MDDSEIAAGNTQYELEASYGVWIQGSPQKQKKPIEGSVSGAQEPGEGTLNNQRYENVMKN